MLGVIRTRDLTWVGGSVGNSHPCRLISAREEMVFVPRLRVAQRRSHATTRSFTRGLFFALHPPARRAVEPIG
jgi:hypothetical protein